MSNIFKKLKHEINSTMFITRIFPVYLCYVTVIIILSAIFSMCLNQGWNNSSDALIQSNKATSEGRH